MRPRQARQRVENCLTIGPPRGLLRNTEGIWYWDRYISFVHYNIDASTLTLQLYFNREDVSVEQDIRLVNTDPNYGGVRWWFLCPRCSRRASRLHLPSRGGSRFFCSRCHDLSYESAQSSRKKSTRFFQGIAKDLESSTREARLWFRVTRGGAVHEVKRPVIEKVRDRRTGIALMVTKQARRQGLSV
jgi:hypothetical protein